MPRPVQGLQRYLVSASQVLISAPWRRRGRYAVVLSTSVTMRHTASRSLVAVWRIVTFASSMSGWFDQWQRLGTAIARMHTIHSQLLRKDGRMSAVALGVGLDSLAHRG